MVYILLLFLYRNRSGLSSLLNFTRAGDRRPVTEPVSLGSFRRPPAQGVHFVDDLKATRTGERGTVHPLDAVLR